jgi:hypothetical protein
MDAVFALAIFMEDVLEEVAEMDLQAEAMPPEGSTRRESDSHIGDFTLFGRGSIPKCYDDCEMHLYLVIDFVDYCEQGKKSYFIASTFDDEQSPILRRLSREFRTGGVQVLRRDPPGMGPQRPRGLIFQ